MIRVNQQNKSSSKNDGEIEPWFEDKCHGIYCKRVLSARKYNHKEKKVNEMVAQ